MRQTSSSSQSGPLERRSVLRLVCALPFALIVAGCGQKGPLYHPPESDDEDEADENSAVPRSPRTNLA